MFSPGSVEMEKLLSSVIFKTVMVPLRRGRFPVVHLYSSFSTHPYGGFPHRDKFIPKITNFDDCWEQYAHISKPTTVKFGTRMRTYRTPPVCFFIIFGNV